MAQTYRSASTEYALYVEPKNPTGRCPAEYTLRHDGKLLWKQTLEFTLTEVVISNRGTTLGFHTTSPWDTRGKEREMLVAIVDVAGKTLHRKSHPIRETSALPYRRDPNPIGLVLQNERNTGILRSLDRGGRDLHEHWWVYDLENGERRTTFDIERRFAKQRARGPIRSIQELPGTPLLLVHWAIRPQVKSKETIEPAFQFAALDGRFRVLWTLDAEKYNEITPGAPDGEFVVHDRSAELKIQLRATPDGKRWKVRELSREPFKDPNPPLRDPEPPRRGP